MSTALISLSVHDADGNTLVDLAHPVNVAGIGREVQIELSLDRLDLSAGEYSLAVGVHVPEFLYAYDYLWEAARFTVVGAQGSTPFLPPHSWRAR